MRNGLKSFLSIWKLFLSKIVSLFCFRHWVYLYLSLFRWNISADWRLDVNTSLVCHCHHLLLQFEGEYYYENALFSFPLSKLLSRRIDFWRLSCPPPFPPFSVFSLVMMGFPSRALLKFFPPLEKEKRKKHISLKLSFRPMGKDLKTLQLTCWPSLLLERK